MDTGRSRSRARRAVHAGSWYDSDRNNLANEIQQYLLRASHVCAGKTKALICPHAGLRYSGPTAAHAWKQVDPATIKRVFLLGPSHHKYFKGVALPPPNCLRYETPLGDLPLDSEVLESLRKSGAFSSLSSSDDENEHSIELLLPFVRHVFPSEVAIVPLVVGDLKTDADFQRYADLLIGCFLQDENLFAFSSDFCHWGPRYSYRYLEAPASDVPIHASIERMDRKAASFIVGHQSKEFFQYLESTGLSVCGRNPISIFLKLIDLASSRGSGGFSTKLVAYSQSNQVTSPTESSVSYAAICTSRV
ncbi:hypothetical protein Efla_001074 [Eimeria flavescens]